VQTTLIWALLAVNISACLPSPSLTPETRTSSAHRRPPPRNLHSTSSKASNTEQSLFFASLTTRTCERVALPFFRCPVFLACSRSPSFLPSVSGPVLLGPCFSLGLRCSYQGGWWLTVRGFFLPSFPFTLSLLSSYSRPREREDGGQKRCEERYKGTHRREKEKRGLRREAKG